MKIGSLFDGSGGFPLAGSLCGFTPAWASEVEPYPIAVTRARFPGMIHLGDVSEVNGAELEPVDVITFGSPCQDLSIAGKRAGLQHEASGDEQTTRSGLFMEAVRIIKEMRNKTYGEYPRYAVWENVLGAFSSNKGEDFRRVLEALIGIKEPGIEVPAPDKSRWPKAQLLLGDGWSLAWRVLDAQYWGVPQRRRRIYLVTDFAGHSAGEVLFEPESVSWDSAQGFHPWERTAGTSPAGAGAAGTGICLNDQGGSCIDVSYGVVPTLRAETHGNLPCVMGATVYENHRQDVRYSGPLETAPTCCARYGTGGNNQPLVVAETPKTLKIRSGCEGGGKGPLIQDDKSATLGCNNDQTLFVPTVFGICSKKSNSMKSSNPHSGIYKAETSRTLDGNGGNPTCNQGGMVVVALQGSMIGRAEKNDPQGSGVNEDVSFTLDAADRHAVAYCMTTGTYTQTLEEQSPTLMARDYKNPPVVNETEPEYIVRRLTPTECARLQGFPDWWGHVPTLEELTDEDYQFWLGVRNTHAAINGKATKEYTKRQMLAWYNKLHTDSAEYKMWGNGIALPCAHFVMQGIAKALKND